MPRYRIVICLLIIPLSLFAQDIDEAIRLFNTFQFEKARDLFVEIIGNESHPRIAEAFYYLGRLSLNPDSSLVYYQKVIKNHPQSRFADLSYLEIAKMNITMKNYKNAIVTLNEMLRQFPETSSKDEALFWLGVSYISSGDDKQGKAVLDNLKSAFPKSIWAERAKTIIPDRPVNPPLKEYFTVQVGSYRNRDNAEKYVQDLKAKGLTAQIVQALVMGNTYFRVWVGQFQTIEQAKAFALKLDSLGIKGNVVKGN